MAQKCCLSVCKMQMFNRLILTFFIVLYFQSSNDNGSKITNFLLEWDEVSPFLVEKVPNNVMTNCTLRILFCFGSSTVFSATA